MLTSILQWRMRKKDLKAEYSPDGVHPNLEGYKVMDDLVEKAISKALKSR